MDKEGVAATCEGKQKFASKQEVFKIFDRHGRQKPMAYHCRSCGHYHVARQKGRPAANKQKVRQYIKERAEYFKGKPSV